MSIILPLHPKWATRILGGLKTIEVRKTFTKPENLPTQAYIYTATPVKAITGVVGLLSATSYTEMELKDRQEQTRIPHAHLSAYLQGKKGIGITTVNPKWLKTPIPLSYLRETFGFTAPQNFAFAKQELDHFLSSQPLSPYSIHPLQAHTLPIIHPLTNLLRLSYPEADTWLDKVRQENRPCWGLYKDNELTGWAILADKGQNKTKLCSFIAAEKGTGTPFLNHVIAHEQDKGTKLLYGEANTHSENVIAFFKKKKFKLSQSPKPNTTLMTLSL